MTLPRLLLPLLLPLLFTGGCRQSNTFAPPPPPEVTVAPPEVRDVTVYDSHPGRLLATESIEIRARVSGYLQKVCFKDGDVVEKGALLCVIEPAPYQAALIAAQAKLAGAQANRDIAQVAYERREKAFSTRAISEIDLLKAKADLAAAKAAVLGAEAALSKARLDLSYTTNRAPMAGRLSRKRVSEGNLVGGSDATLITTLIVNDPIYLYFNVSERTLLRFMGRLSREKADLKKAPPIKLRLAQGAIYEREGRLDFVDNRVDPETGTIEVRATFPNPDYRLLPGLYGDAMIPDVRTNAILVPDLAVQRDIGGTYVLVVGAENKVESKYVQPGPKVEQSLRIIESGLDPTDRVIINGLQRARPGVVVKPVSPPAEPPAATPAPVGNTNAPSAKKAASSKSPPDKSAPVPAPDSVGGTNAPPAKAAAPSQPPPAQAAPAPAGSTNSTS